MKARGDQIRHNRLGSNRADMDDESAHVKDKITNLAIDQHRTAFHDVEKLQHEEEEELSRRAAAGRVELLAKKGTIWAHAASAGTGGTFRRLRKVAAFWKNPERKFQICQNLLESQQNSGNICDFFCTKSATNSAIFN